MKRFISLTTNKNEVIACNVDKILFICSTKSGSVVYFNDLMEVTCKSSIDEILSLINN